MSVNAAIQKISDAGFSLSVSEGRLKVVPFRSLTDDQRQFLADYKPEIIQALRARELESSSAGNDIPASNHAPSMVECWTPNGSPVTVEASNKDQAEWIKAHNKPCQKSKPVAPPELPQVANPGVPSDLHMLATRYCAEVFGDGPEAIAAMLDDLMTAPNDWHFWKADFIRKLSIPDQARCCDCQHSEFVHGGLGRCLRGIQSPGAAGWWLTDQHHCLGFTARLQPQIPECPGISGWRFATNNEELK